jgi:hypothetical protein
VERLFVRHGRCRVTVDLDEHEAARVLAVREQIEADDAGLSAAGLGVGEGRQAKGIFGPGLHADVDVNDEQASGHVSSGRGARYVPPRARVKQRRQRDTA